jgi:hypothetical protein
MRGQGLLRRQAPVLAEARVDVNGGKTPESGVPSCALAFHLVWAARDVAALDDFLQEAVLQQPLPDECALYRVHECVQPRLLVNKSTTRAPRTAWSSDTWAAFTSARVQAPAKQARSADE